MTFQDSIASHFCSVRARRLSTLTYPQGKREILASLVKSEEAARVEVVPASSFTLEELVAAYNQTRVDYIVPMPMSAARLHEYVHKYDVDLERSAVALEDGHILGLAMLGVRAGRSWITRMGVLPPKRRRGTGQRLAEHLIAQSLDLEVPYIIIEVIKHNEPAHQLFRKLGFRETRELLIIRRPPGPPAFDVGPYVAQALDYHQALELLHKRRNTPAWLNETESLKNAGNLAGLHVALENGDWGWVVYQETIFQLGHLVLQTEAGDPHRVGLALIHALHTRHPATDTKSENLHADDPHWPAMQEAGYIESFRRIEMRLDL
jgi:ribosomal protein S18 acetylase RimI-like enzyme